MQRHRTTNRSQHEGGRLRHLVMAKNNFNLTSELIETYSFRKSFNDFMIKHLSEQNGQFMICHEH